METDINEADGQVPVIKNSLANVKRQDKADNTQTLNREAWKELYCSASLFSSVTLSEEGLRGLRGSAKDFRGGKPPVGVFGDIGVL